MRVVVVVVRVRVRVGMRVGDKKGAKWSGLLWLLQRPPGRFTTKIYYKQYINLALEQVLSFTRAHNLLFIIYGQEGKGEEEEKGGQYKSRARTM